MSFSVKKAQDVNTSALVGIGLMGGWITARETGIRPLGTVPLVAAWGWAARSWYHKGGWPVALGLSAAYMGAFGLSHPLAKKLGSWPAVITTVGAAAAAAYVVNDSR